MNKDTVITFACGHVGPVKMLGHRCETCTDEIMASLHSQLTESQARCAELDEVSVKCLRRAVTAEAKIDKAPHGPYCALNLVHPAQSPVGKVCDCWKSQP